MTFVYASTRQNLTSSSLYLRAARPAEESVAGDLLHVSACCVCSFETLQAAV